MTAAAECLDPRAFDAPVWRHREKPAWVIERDLPFNTVNEHRGPIAVRQATEDEPTTP